MITVIIVDMGVKLIVKHMKGSMEYMSEKRFYTDGQYVMQDMEVYVICNGEHNADVVATALNELLGENGQLIQENKELKEQLEDCTQKAKEEIRNCGHCKHFQIDGMFGMWCDINDTDYLLDGKCLNYEENKR